MMATDLEAFFNEQWAEDELPEFKGILLTSKVSRAVILSGKCASYPRALQSVAKTHVEAFRDKPIGPTLTRMATDGDSCQIIFMALVTLQPETHSPGTRPSPG